MQTVIEKSVQRYISEGSIHTKAQITVLLHEWAREISIQMTDGGSSEIPVHKYMLPSEAKNNVICLRKTGESIFALRFYHNAIREYLVAEELYQDIKDCINGNAAKVNALKKRMQQLALTSEMIGFFTQLAEKTAE